MIHERRGVQRVRPGAPMRATAGEHPVFVLDISTRGIRLAHQADLGPVGTRVRVAFEWDGESIDIHCELRWTAVHSKARRPEAKPVHHSGLALAQPQSNGARKLAAIVESHVVRALDEQKANARGIPAVAANSFQTGAARSYARHQLIGKGWQETPTTDPRQPLTGFTVASDQSRDEIAMLRVAWEAADNSQRQIIRKFAELSISNSDGIPTRKYNP